MPEAPPPVESHQIPSPKEPQLLTEVCIRRLDPESQRDIQLAQDLDAKSQEAYKPVPADAAANEEESHALMSEDELKEWMRDRENGMLRVIEVIDPKTKEKKAVGFIFFYDDTNLPKGQKLDEEQVRRASEVRKTMNLAETYPVWEMNFWVDPETSDIVLQKAVEMAVAEFHTKGQPATLQADGEKTAVGPKDRALVMFIDSEDIQDAVLIVCKNKKITRERLFDLLQDAKEREQIIAGIEGQLQDIRMLRGLGFVRGGEMKYEKTNVLQDWWYIKGMFQQIESSVSPLAPPVSA